MDIVLVVLKVQLHADQMLFSWFLRSLFLILSACSKDLCNVLQTVGELPGYYIYSEPHTLICKGQSALLVGRPRFLHADFCFCLLTFEVHVFSMTAMGRKMEYF